MVVRDNVHKSYLLRLAAAGVAVTPTVLATRGSQRSLPDLVAAARWHDVVVKPAVGAGSFATHRLQERCGGGVPPLVRRIARAAPTC
jgi:glutathione synthase/RimK-type ligase-like ATP-grasp enzyme